MTVTKTKKAAAQAAKPQAKRPQRQAKPITATDAQMEVARQRKMALFKQNMARADDADAEDGDDEEQEDGVQEGEDDQRESDNDEEGDDENVGDNDQAVEGENQAAVSKPKRGKKPVNTSKNLDKRRRAIRKDEWEGLIYIDDERELNAYIEEPKKPGSGTTGGLVVADFCAALGITEDEHAMMTVSDLSTHFWREPLLMNFSKLPAQLMIASGWTTAPGRTTQCRTNAKTSTGKLLR